MITQQELKELAKYDPNSGVFTWLVAPSNKARAGDVVGYLNNGYIRASIKGTLYYIHRLAWLITYGEWPAGDIDHINQNRLDNRIDNLRVVDQKENQRNRRLSKNNTSGVCGVGWLKVEGKWGAQIKVNGKVIRLGCSIDKFEAICARMSANNKYGFHANHGR